MSKPFAPDFALRNRKIFTQREWRRLKRHELEAAVKAVHQLRIGCLYTPLNKNGDPVGTIERILQTLREAWSRKNWGD